MPRKRKLITVSFPNAEDLAEAQRKAKQGKRGGLSKEIQRHFKNLADLEKSKR